MARNRKVILRSLNGHLTVVWVVADLLLQVIRGDVVWLRPLACGRRLEFPTAAVAAAAEAAAAVASGQDPTHRKQTLEEEDRRSELESSDTLWRSGASRHPEHKRHVYH